MYYDVRKDLLFLKKLIDEQDEKISRLEKAVKNLLEVTNYLVKGVNNEDIER